VPGGAKMVQGGRKKFQGSSFPPTSRAYGIMYENPGGPRSPAPRCRSPWVWFVWKLKINRNVY